MNQKTSGTVLAALSVAYGITLGILGYFGSSIITPFAVIGALVLGGLWAIRGLLVNRERDRSN